MRNALITSVVLPLLAGLSLALNAAPAPSGVAQAPMLMASPAAVQAVKVNLNKADAVTLQHQLDGIGKAKAEAIVSYRSAHGPFNSVDELLEVKGIGSALLERNRSKLTVK